MSVLGEVKKLFYNEYKRALKNGLTVGKDVSIVGDVDFGSEPYLISLGDRVRVSFGVTFITHDGGTWAFRDLPEHKDVIKYGKIKVGSNTFIGARSIIMPGVTIGERCVIGCGSIVTKDIPDNSVVCGVPAEYIMSTSEYAEKCKNNMKPYDHEKYRNNKKDYLLEYLE